MGWAWMVPFVIVRLETRNSNVWASCITTLLDLFFWKLFVLGRHSTESGSSIPKASLVTSSRMEGSGRQPRKWTLVEDQILREEVEAQCKLLLNSMCYESRLV